MAIDIKTGVISVTSSCIFFLICRRLCHPVTKSTQTSDNTTNKQKRCTNNTPWSKVCTWLTESNGEHWKRTNTWISFLHSFVSGTLAVYSCWAYSPYIHRDYVNHISRTTYLACCFSCGYFIYDLIDVISNESGSVLWELMMHHLLALVVFVVSICRQLNIGYLMIALIAEVNSVFLHARKLFQLHAIPREQFIVRFNMIVNMFTFIICRFGVLVYSSMSLLRDGYRVGEFFYIYAMYVFLPLMWIMNPFLFYRLLYTDFLKKIPSQKLTS